MGGSVFAEFPSRCCSVFLSSIPLISLYLLLINSNPRAHILECTNFIQDEPLQMLPQCVAYDRIAGLNLDRLHNEFQPSPYSIKDLVSKTNENKWKGTSTSHSGR